MKKVQKEQKAPRITMKARRNNAMYCKSLQLNGNAKLTNCMDEYGVWHKYMQFNVLALLDCPFKSKGCAKVCYATKGHHVFPNVKESRQRAHDYSMRDDFSEMMIYTINTEMKYSRKFQNAKVILRIHESGDFYNLKYLRKWLKIWTAFRDDEQILFTFYTKSFLYFLQLTAEEKEMLKDLQAVGRVSVNLSMDDTTSPEQRARYLQMLATFPKSNTYYCTEDITTVKHDKICDCKDCAACGICNHANGYKTVVKIHSATEKDLKEYRANIVA